MSLLENLNLFPETRYLRCRRGYQLDNRWGGLAGIIIIALIVVILSVKLIDMFSMKTIFFTANTLVNQNNPSIILSTYPNDTDYTPFMMAFQHVNVGCTNNTIGLYAFNYTYTNLSTTTNNFTSSEIALESCTAAHFTMIPGIEQNQVRLGIDRWRCLPLNHRY